MTFETFDDFLKARAEYLREYDDAVRAANKEHIKAKARRDEAERAWMTVWDKKSREIYERRVEKERAAYNVLCEAQKAAMKASDEFRRRMFGGESDEV